MECLVCGEQIDRENQPWRLLNVIQPPSNMRPDWEPDLGDPSPDDLRDYMARLGEIDGYPVHVACLRRVMAEKFREDPILRQPSR
jgi:hypothetical protein